MAYLLGGFFLFPFLPSSSFHFFPPRPPHFLEVEGSRNFPPFVSPAGPPIIYSGNRGLPLTPTRLRSSFSLSPVLPASWDLFFQTTRLFVFLGKGPLHLSGSLFLLFLIRTSNPSPHVGSLGRSLRTLSHENLSNPFPYFNTVCDRFPFPLISLYQERIKCRILLLWCLSFSPPPPRKARWPLPRP